MKQKRIISILLAFSMVFIMLLNSAIPAFATDIEIGEGSTLEGADTVLDGSIASGICGDNLTWRLDNTGTLTISGTGDTTWDEVPWVEYKELIKKVVVEEGVTGLAEKAFAYCANLESVILPESMINMGRSAFTCCSSLREIVIPDSITTINDLTFVSCTALESIVIPDGVISIGSSSFSGCSSLKSITLPKSVTSIDFYAFYDAVSLTDVYYNGSQSMWNEISVGGYNEYLTNATIHYGMGDGGSVYNVTIQYYSEYDDQTYILSESVVDEFTQLSQPEISIPEGYHQDIYGWQYYGYDDEGNFVSGTWDFENSIVNADITIYTNVYRYRTITFDTLGGMEAPQSVTVPRFGMLGDYIDTLPVGESEDGYCLAAWYYDTAYTNPVTLELDRLSGDVTVYPLWAQLHATASDLPSEEDIIAEGECGDNGDNVVWTLCADGELIISGTGAMVDVISSEYWTDYKGDVTKVTVKNGVTKISMQAFSVMTNLKEVSLPDTLTWIREFAFIGCESLEKINIPSSVNTMEWFIFDGCTMLKTAGPVGSGCNIEFGWDKEIPAKAFQHSNASLNSVIIPYGIEKIGDEAFFSCMNITEVTLPETVTSIGFNAFGACNNLKTVNLPSSLEELGAQAFWGFSQIESIVIPDGITEIKDMTFQLCETLKEITIPVSVTSIGESAFDGATALTDVYYGGTEAQWNRMSIGSSNESLTNATIHYGAGKEYTVTIEYGVEQDVLNNYSNITLDTFTVKYGEKLEEPVLEVPEGYSMNPHGWSYYGRDAAGNPIGGDWDFDTSTVSADITIFILISKDRTVTFDTLGRCDAPDPVTVPKYGMLTSLPTGESEDGYCLSAWYYEPEYIRPVTLEYDEIFEDTTIYAKWEQLHATASELPGEPEMRQVCIMCYSEYDGTTVISTLEVEPGTILTEPEIYVPEGYHISEQGWYYYATDINHLGEHGLWSFENEVPYSITIMIDVYQYRTITFDTLGRCETPDPVTVPRYGLLGDYIDTLPTGETEDGYCLEAWYYDTDYTNPVTLELDRPSSDVTIYAKWSQLHATASDLPGEEDIIAEGECGDNATWTLDAEGTLTISGTGAMWSPATESAKYEEYISAWNELDKTSSRIAAIIIEEGVTDISSFAGLTNVKSVKIAGSVTNTDEAAFASCTSLQEVILSENLTYLGYNLFDNCTNLETIVLPDGVTSIMFEAFKDCTNLKEITISENVSSIWEGAFAGCTNLTTVYFGGNSEQWNAIRVDSNNDSLLNATIIFEVSDVEPTPTPEPETVSSGTCGDNLTWTLDSEGTLTVSGTGAMYAYESVIDIPWYEQRQGIKTAVIEEGVTVISDYMLYDCDNLTDMQMPNSLIEIGKHAFGDCYRLRTLHFPENVEVIPGNICASLRTMHPDADTNQGDTAVESITIDESNKTFYIENQILYRKLDDGTVLMVFGSWSKPLNFMTGKGPCGNNVTWTKYNYDYGLVISGTGAMADYESYEDTMWYKYGPPVSKAKVEEGVTYIGRNSFGGLNVLTYVDIPESMIAIGENAFTNCVALTDVYYAGSPSMWDEITIGSNNEYLTNANIHYGKQDILVNGQCGDNLTWTLDSEGTLTISGTGAMYDYEYTVYGPWHEYEKDIRKVVIKEGVTSVGKYAFTYSSVLEEVTLPESINEIGWGTFAYCPLITEVRIPNGVIEIKDVTFYGCDSLQTVHIPESVIIIGVDSFRNCTTLTDIYYGGSPLLWQATGFDVNYKEFENVNIHFAKENEDITGVCGNNLIWVLDASGTLTVSGTGAMNTNVSDVYDIADIPWYNYRASINKIVIENGITNIDDYAFYDCANLTQVTIGEDVTWIDEEVFRYCNSLETVYVPKAVTHIGGAAFGSCTALKYVNYGGSERRWNVIEIGIGNEYLLNSDVVYAEIEKYTVTVEKPENCDFIIANQTAGETALDYVFEASYGDVITIESVHPACHSVRQYIVNEDSYPMNPVTFTVTGDTEIWVEYDIEHISGTIEQENIVEATCTAEGSYEEVGHCEACNEEIYRQTMSIPVLPHTEKTREEDVVEPTCTENGSYYEVLYCTVCDTELSSTLVETSPLGHSYEVAVTPPTETEQGYTTYTCSVCGDSYVDDYTDPTGPREEVEIEVENTASTAGATVAEPEGGWTEGENTFTVSAEKPCVVVVSYDGGQTYTRVTAAATGTDGTYSFTADITAGAQVAVAVAGDTDGNGKINIIDCVQLKAATLGTRELGALNKVTCDTDGNGKINIIDCVQLKAATLGTRQLTW